MKCLGLIKNELKLGEEEIAAVKEDIEQVEGVLEKYKISFVGTFAISFYNHIISFIGRARTGDFIGPIGEEMVSELTEESIKIAAELLEKIFNKYKREQNKSEIYLVSIHIQVAKENQK